MPIKDLENIKILVIDDDLDVGHYISDILAQEKIQSKVLTDSKTALEVIQSYKPSIVISDIKMPNLSGTEIAEKIRKNFPQIKIVLMSGHYAELFDDLVTKRSLADHVIYKPFLPSDIISTVQLFAESAA
jgi:DNA-binding response OmpR family regulator